MTWTLRVWGAGLLSLAATCQVARAAAPSYSLIELGDLPGGTIEHAPHDINNYGQIVGQAQLADTTNRAYLWTPATPNGVTGSMIDIGGLSLGTSSVARSINEQGQVTGESQPAVNQNHHAFIWTPTTPNTASGSMVDLGVLQGASSAAAVRGIALNEHGQVVATHSIPTRIVPALWTPTTPNASSGSMVIPGGFVDNDVQGMNDYGQIVGSGSYGAGTQAYFWTPDAPNSSTGQTISLENPPSGPTLKGGGDINNAGQIVGGGLINNKGHALLWTPTTPNGTTGTAIDLGDLPGGTDSSGGVDINEFGDIIGESFGAAGQRAVLWTRDDHQLYDLNALLDHSYPGWTLRTAFAINDLRQIVVQASYDPDGAGGVAPQFRSVLLTPVPEPSSLGLLALGGMGLLKRRRGR